MAAWYNNIVHWLEVNMFTCPTKKYLGIDCPGCGLQRSMVALLKGDLTTSFSLYPATIPIMLILGFTFFHLIFKFEKGGRIIIFLQAVTAMTILVFYIYKIITHKITA